MPDLIINGIVSDFCTFVAVVFAIVALCFFVLSHLVNKKTDTPIVAETTENRNGGAA